MGGSSSSNQTQSSSSQSSTNTTSTQNYDNRVAATDQAIVAGAGSSINVQRADADIIRQATEANAYVANQALQANKASSEASLKVARDVSADALQSNRSVAADAFDFGDNALSANKDVTREAFGFGRESLNIVEDVSGKAIDEFQVLAARQVDSFTEQTVKQQEFATQLVDQALTAAQSESEKANAQAFDVVKTTVIIGALALTATLIFSK